jgi:HD-GYP domain-containing protein (c-di-GMP phosphodiesterase class II)
MVASGEPLNPPMGGASRESIPRTSEGRPREADTAPVSTTTSGAVAPQPADLDPEGDVLVAAGREGAVRRLGRDSLAAVLGAALFLAAALPLAFLAPSDRAPSAVLLVLLVASYALVSRVEFEVGFGTAVPTQLVLVPMLFVLPVGMVPLCVAAGLLLAELPEVARGRRHPERSLLHLTNSWHALGPAAVLVLAGEPAPSWSLWPVLVAAFAAQVALDFLSSVGRAWNSFGLPPRSQLRLMGLVWGVDAVLAPLGFLLALVAFDTPYAFLLALPLVGLLAFFARERTRRIDHALELSHAYRGTAFLLGDVIEADDAYTGSHSRDVVELVLAVADELNLDHRETRDAELTALLHDVGKIRVPGEIISKPGPLTDAEWEVMKTHTIEGERMLEQVGGLLGRVGRLVRSCHERWDGAGYPDGLLAEQIPLVARIVCACDAYNAMTTDRPYRTARPAAEALAEMERCAGTQFDPTVVAALATVVGR